MSQALLVMATGSILLCLLGRAILPTLAGASASRLGPGTDADHTAGRAGLTGGPYEGYHIVTRDPSQAWDAQITLKDGSKAQNQYIARDAVQDAAAISIDPADGVYGDGSHSKGTQNYKWNKLTKLWDIPEGKPHAGYPSTPIIPGTYVSVMQIAGRDLAETSGSAQGLSLMSNDGAAAGYNDLAAEKDFLLLVFGARWCANFEDFKLRFARYYQREIANQQPGKSFDAVYFSNDNSPFEFKQDIKQLPFKVVSLDRALAVKLERVLGMNEVPAVIVVNKAGEVVTTDGIRAIRGTSNNSNFPLPSGKEFFADVPTLADEKSCVVDESAQHTFLERHVEEQVDAMDHEALLTEAHKVAQGPQVFSDTLELKQFVKGKILESIGQATASEIQNLYAQEQELASHEPSYVFKVGDYVSVNTAFRSNPQRSGTNTIAPPASDGYVFHAVVFGPFAAAFCGIFCLGGRMPVGRKPRVQGHGEGAAPGAWIVASLYMVLILVFLAVLVRLLV